MNVKNGNHHMHPVVLSGMLDSETVNKILDLQKTDLWFQGRVMGGLNGESIVNTNQRVVDNITINIMKNPWLPELLFDIVKNLDHDYDIKEVNQCELLKYGVGGKYDFHQDVIWKNRDQPQRKLTIIVQLSDENDYEEGDIVVKGCDFPKDVRKRGTVIIFPSNMKHQVNPVKSGVRYSLVSWAVGPYCEPGPNWR